ncbi:peptidase C39 family protein [Haladaptatus caseinilyticus]|uniref:peptidase C39 family protein n=1 Tax=Haladaptatus caseinilyticus TaxID=2993314 RepID=UPI00224A83D9|nr:peptidase C39 family protein [Haladaptatus caseinilyticus]
MNFGAKQLIASWTADIPQGTWMEVEMRGTTTSGERTGWYVMGRWATTDEDIHRTSVFNQGDEYGRIAVDTFKAADGTALRSYQLRTTLYRLPERDHAPVLRSLSAMTSRLPDQDQVSASPLGGAAGITLDVPEYSQSIHLGEYPQWDGGGEAWCSPTSTAMVISYWGRGPTEEQMSWVDPAYQDPQVDFAARGTFDYGYDGAGNWPFNIAYAGRFGLEGYVTRLHSLNELEQYIKAGIPVITSQSFEEEELPGAGYGTNGHLMVIVGFTENGDVVANDPVAPTNEDVRLVYPRDAFENVWQRTSGTGGIAYIIHPPGHDLPDGAPTGQRDRGGSWKNGRR